MKHPTTLKETAELLSTTQKHITQIFQQAGHIRRCPMTDQWRVTAAGEAASTVVEFVRGYQHPAVGMKQYTQVRITAEGRRHLKAVSENAA